LGLWGVFVGVVVLGGVGVGVGWLGGGGGVSWWGGGGGGGQKDTTSFKVTRRLKKGYEDPREGPHLGEEVKGRNIGAKGRVAQNGETTVEVALSKKKGEKKRNEHQGLGLREGPTLFRISPGHGTVKGPKRKRKKWRIIISL